MAKSRAKTRPKSGVPAPKGEGIWARLNSPLAITILTSVVIAGGAKLYSDIQDEKVDQLSRRAAYARILPEFEHRVTEITNADKRLDPLIGEGTSFKGGKKPLTEGPERDRWNGQLVQIGQQEWDILHGKGSYVPTSPEFAGVSFAVIAARMEDLAGVPDMQIGAMRIFGFFDADRSIIWLPVRSQLPMMQKVSVTKHMMFADGIIPFPRGHVLTDDDYVALGLPLLKPGDLERLERESDQVHAEFLKTLREQGSETAQPVERAGRTKAS